MKKHIKIPSCIKTQKGKVFKFPSTHMPMCPSVWTTPLHEYNNVKKMDQMKMDVKELIVLKKYPIKIAIRFESRITNRVVEVTEASFMITMDEKVFADFFPCTFSQLVFKKLLNDGKARQWISYEDFTSKLPKLVASYSNVTPSLSYKKPYVVFMERSGFFETRRRIAQYLRIVEKYENILVTGEAKVQ